MTKTWYPVIDYEKCVECGACTEKCKQGKHGVYDQSKAPTPVVIFPEGCVQGCRGCANLCPQQAIIYVGDESNKTDGECGCSCNA